MDLNGPNAASGIARRNALSLQVGEFHSASGRGIPAGANGKPRPVAFVVCSEVQPGSSTTDSKRPGAHLVQALHVPAILGTAGTDSTLDLLTGIAIPSGTVIFAPSVSSASLTTFADKELFWRTAPSGVLQAKALQRQVLELEAKVRSLNPSLSQIKVALAFSDEAFGNDLSAEVTKNLTFNGQPEESQPANFLNIKYNQVGTDADYTAVATAINAFAPHIVALIGRAESPKLLKGLEALAPATGIRPEWLFSASSNVATLRTEPAVVNNVNNVRSRMRGTIATTPAGATGFDSLYTSANFPAPASIPSFGASGAYDIGYLLSYAALAASPRGEPLAGADMVRGLKRVLGGPESNAVRVGVSDINQAFTLIPSGADVNVKGFSYELNFDLTVGEPPARFNTWCARRNGASVELPSAGQVFNLSVNPPTLSGTFVCPPDI